ncbi:TPA: group II intron reverse transcriptase/maturase [Serratia fonticola]|uniref:group II intron reverse transcriptase/maturase n=1 Tax=Serratia fonticola TaxID=47917 RepID=UPI00217B0D90|nr:group II intron reverse transcriptase/maturase [Serratia fonticola]CAI2008313.1 Group II intron-encoded protein ltrA [Serratia fonticola]
MDVDDAQVRETVARAEGSEQNSRGSVAGAEAYTAKGEQTKAEVPLSMDAVITRSNLMLAYQRVVENKGAAGVDNLSVGELKGWLKQHWASVREALLQGNYVPQAIRQVEIPKPDGGVRTLGIPTVVDRLIQQAIQQHLTPYYESEFSDSSYGFRPGRNGGQAVQQAQAYMQSGRRWVVDLELEKFFDRVNHDILMSRLSRKIKDGRLLKLIRRYLEADRVKGSGVTRSREGMPQGGPLSPLLSNILLTDLDRELERRGHKFCRYADDCNIYVCSRQAGEHAMKEISHYLENKLRLKVNPHKSAVDRPWKRKFLGYSVTQHKITKLKISDRSLSRLKDKIRRLTMGNSSYSVKAVLRELNPVLRGWMKYFGLTEVKGCLEEVDGWIRRRLRSLIWQNRKRSYARARMLMRRGLTEEKAWISASNQRGPWWNSGASHMNHAFPKKWFSEAGLLSLLELQRQFQR